VHREAPATEDPVSPVADTSTADGHSSTRLTSSASPGPSSRAQRYDDDDRSRWPEASTWWVPVLASLVAPGLN